LSKKDKLRERLFRLPKDFTWDELTSVLGYYGYEQLPSKGTSARKFVDGNNHIISLHKPHPGNICKKYVLEIIISAIKDQEDQTK
jgi:hypothetical protein